jgi:uncharacterized protein YlxP (DUF503 family)
MVVGVCRLSLVLGAGQSLKVKRSVLHRIKDRVRNKFNVSIAEVGSQDLWQRIELGLAVTGNDGGHVNSQLDKVQNFIGSLGLAQIVDSWIELIHFNDAFPDYLAGEEGGEDEAGADEGEPIDAGEIVGEDD